MPFWSRKPRPPPSPPPSSLTFYDDALVPYPSAPSLRPIEFQPNRTATLYITPSDRNLYLTAMSQLDRPVPALPLWSESAPSLPSVRAEGPFEAELPPRQSSVNPLAPSFVLGQGGRMQPGLTVREEFRTVPYVVFEGP
jgi:hypothetical protein